MPRNNADFHGYQFHYEPDLENHMIVATHPEHGQVGALSWNPEGEVDSVYVDTKHQRRGVATAMWQHAKAWALQNGENGPEKHSEHLSEDGIRWAQAVGGDVMSMEDWYKDQQERGGL